MNTNNKVAYLISITLKINSEQPTIIVWQQEFEPTWPDILSKTVMHCVEKKHSNALLESPVNVVVRKIEQQQIEEIANYNMSKEEIYNEFFEYLELV